MADEMDLFNDHPWFHMKLSAKYLSKHRLAYGVAGLPTTLVFGGVDIFWRTGQVYLNSLIVI